MLSLAAAIDILKIQARNLYFILIQPTETKPLTPSTLVAETTQGSNSNASSLKPQFVVLGSPTHQLPLEDECDQESDISSIIKIRKPE